ncbi:LysR substrate-binding domain-containing protein, partial [Aeromonas caviae]|uniref:LysR substrate-binding domain-containing protein n=2 Tax=Aeromonadaceae TaxID=84642 RepID=UPI00244B2992
PAPTSLEMLSQHELIQFITPSTGRPFPWQFVNEQGDPVDLHVQSRQRVLDDVLAGLGWAVAGGGLFQIYHFVATEALLQGKLIEVMTPFAGRSRPFYALYPQHRHLSARVRAFVDYLLAAVHPEGSPVPGEYPPLR